MMDKLTEVESVAEELSTVMFRYAMQLGCPADYMKALKRWEEYENGS